MQIYFGESGDFKPVDVGTEKFCFVVGLIVPETSIKRLEANFDLFVSKLPQSVFASGEPKGKLLSIPQRKLLLEILSGHPDVLLVPVSVNLGYSGGPFLSTAPAKIRALMESNLASESSDMTKSQRAELAKQFGNLSGQALAKNSCHTALRY